MTEQTMMTVDLVFGEEWEGLDYHRFFWDRCHHRVMLQSVRVEHGMFEHPGHTIFEYDDDRVETESYYAYYMLQTWFGYFQTRRVMRFHFAHKPEAMMFKLTFGGV